MGGTAVADFSPPPLDPLLGRGGGGEALVPEQYRKRINTLDGQSIDPTSCDSTPLR